MCMSDTSTRQHLAIPNRVNGCIPLTGISLLHPANTADHHPQVEKNHKFELSFLSKHTQARNQWVLVMLMGIISLSSLKRFLPGGW